MKSEKECQRIAKEIAKKYHTPQERMDALREYDLSEAETYRVLAYWVKGYQEAEDDED
ncbi:MAG TPA: hypothetical protein VIY48_09305 [Candidatus Paceibacterota bacterium]